MEGGSGSVPFQLFSLIDDAPTGCEPAVMLRGHNETVHKISPVKGLNTNLIQFNDALCFLFRLLSDTSTTHR